MKVVQKKLGDRTKKPMDPYGEGVIKVSHWALLGTGSLPWAARPGDDFERWVAPCRQVERHTIHWEAPIPAML